MAWFLPTAPRIPGTKALQAIIFVNLFAFLAVAYLAGLLTAKLRQVGVQLKDTSGALESLQALHENIIHSISSGLITTGLDGRITLVNAAAQRLLERTPAELLGAPVHQLFLDPLPTVESQQAHGEVRFEPPTKFRKTVRVRVAALTVPERGDLGYVYVLDDLTEIRRLEREVRMQDKLAAVGRLAAAIAHEIRNPLTSIAGSVSMLVRHTGDERGSPPPARHRDPRVAAAEQHHHRLPGLLAHQAISLRPGRSDSVRRRHVDAHGSPHDRGENRDQDRAPVHGAPGVGHCRRRQAQAGVLEPL